MTAIKAADLPEGSVVANASKAWIKADEDNWYRTISDDCYWDSDVQAEIDAGAVVLREGPS